MHKVISIPTALLAALLLSSCASSERMLRMSGAIGTYEKPKKERISSYRPSPGPRRTADELQGFDQSLINLWPFFFRNADYYSALWPMIDRDPYGFAIRPFYNQEGDEHSVLFPLAAWNSASGAGWAANAYWRKGMFGIAPLLHYSAGARFCYYGPFWAKGDNMGFFPVAAGGKGWGQFANCWWKTGRDGAKFSFTMFPITSFSPTGGYFANSQWRYDGDGQLKSLIVLPLAAWRREGGNHMLLWYGNRDKEGRFTTWGVAPGLLHFGERFNLATLAWWEKNAQGEVEKGGVFPFAGWSRTGFNYALLWYGDRDEEGQWNYWGVAPGLMTSNKNFTRVLTAWWSGDDQGELTGGGFFPLAKFHRNGFNYALLWYGDRAGEGKWNYWGIAPGLLHCDENFYLATLAWWEKNARNELERGGVFPFAKWQREGFNYTLLWYGDRTREGRWNYWGVAPGLLHFGEKFNLAFPVWWSRDDQGELKDGGLFPLVEFNRKSSSTLLPLPLVRYTSLRDHSVFPLYGIFDDGDVFVSPLGGWSRKPDTSTMSFLGPLYWSKRKTSIGNLKSDEFTLAALLAYRSREEKYHLPVYGLDSHSTSKEYYDARKPLIWRQLDRLGIPERPETPKEFRKLQETIDAKRELEVTESLGVVPLFSQKSSPDKNEFSLGLRLISHYGKTDNKTEFSLFTPLIFLKQRERDTRDGEYESDSWHALLLFGGKKAVRPPEKQDRWLRELDSIGLRFNAQSAYDTFLRIRAGFLLRKLGVETPLPDYVCDSNSMREFTGEIRKKLRAGAETETSLSLFPLFFQAKDAKKDVTVLYPLLSGYDRNGWLSFPLLSGCMREGRELKTAIVLPLYQKSEFGADADAAVLEHDALKGTAPKHCFSGESTRFLLFQQNRLDYRTPATPGEAAALTRIFSLVKSWEETAALLAESDLETREFHTALSTARPDFATRQAVDEQWPRITRKVPFYGEVSQMRNLWESNDRLHRQVADCRKKLAKALGELGKSYPAPESLEDARALARTLNAEAVKTTELRSFSSPLWSRVTVGPDSHWQTLLFLADGERHDDTGSERISVLKFFYRYQRAGSRSDTLIFPFISLRREKDDYQFNFLHRVFSTYRKGGQTGGHILYIPF